MIEREYQFSIEFSICSFLSRITDDHVAQQQVEMWLQPSKLSRCLQSCRFNHVHHHFHHHIIIIYGKQEATCKILFMASFSKGSSVLDSISFSTSGTFDGSFHQNAMVVFGVHLIMMWWFFHQKFDFTKLKIVFTNVSIDFVISKEWSGWWE